MCALIPDLRLITLLISGWTPLHEAVLGQNCKAAKILIEAGALVSSVGLEGITPLHDAVQLGDFKVCGFSSLWTNTLVLLQSFF